MNREDSWQVERLTPALLRHITAIGGVVSVHRIPALLRGESGPFVEMHATGLQTDPPAQHIASVGADDGGDTDYRCACALAQLVGVRFMDG